MIECDNEYVKFLDNNMTFLTYNYEFNLHYNKYIENRPRITVNFNANRLNLFFHRNQN